MFEKKKTKSYEMGEMRPLSALSANRSEKPQPKKNVTTQIPASPQMQSTVSSLSEQNKINDAVTAQQAPLYTILREKKTEKAAEERTGSFKPEQTSELAEMKPAISRTESRWQRSRTDAPDLSDKRARDAFFARYITPESTARCSADERRMMVDREGTPQNSNPFRNRPDDLATVSHAKEEPETAPEQKEPLDTKETAAEPVSSSMTESIENAAMAIRQERETRMAQTLSPEMEKAETLSLRIRMVVLLCTAAVCSLLMMGGERSAFFSEGQPRSATVPPFSVHTYLNGEFTSGISAYYKSTAPMRSSLDKVMAAVESMKGFDNSSNELDVQDDPVE